MLLSSLLNYIHEYCDAPRPWGLYFQDSAAPQMEALVELHDNIMYYLITILFGVSWILASIVKNYASNRSPISHKYLNHGIYNVPIFNISNPISPLLSEAGRMMVVLTVKAKLRAHSYYDLGAPSKHACRVERTKIIKFWFKTVPVTRGLNLINLTGGSPIYKYILRSCLLPKKLIMSQTYGRAENENKSGIYRWTNKCSPQPPSTSRCLLRVKKGSGGSFIEGLDCTRSDGEARGATAS